MLIKIKEFEKSEKGTNLVNLKKIEKEFKYFLKRKFLAFPIHCIEIENGKKNNIEIHIYLDEFLRSEFFYNKIVYKVFQKLDIDFNLFEKSSTNYYFYGQKKIFNFNCKVIINKQC